MMRGRVIIYFMLLLYATWMKALGITSDNLDETALETTGHVLFYVSMIGLALAAALYGGRYLKARKKIDLDDNENLTGRN